jgi:hypothetical protein
MARCLLFFFAILFLPLAHARAETTVSLLVIGPGPEIFERYGHCTIRIRRTEDNLDVSVDWGQFDFEQPGFVRNFVFGKMRYGMGSYHGQKIVDLYLRTGRDVTEYELNLSPQQIETLLKNIDTASRPENSTYDYDYFRHNCSTIVRDQLDAAIGGQLKSQTQDRTDRSLRDHTARLTPGGTVNNVLWLLMNPSMGSPIDAKLTRWESMYLPMELGRAVEAVQTTGADGTQTPLVRTQRELQRASVAPLIEASRPQSGLNVLVGVGAALWSAAIVFGARRSRLLLRLTSTPWLLLAGVWGCFNAFTWIFTHHWVAQYNANLFAMTPLALAMGFTVWWTRLDRVSGWLAWSVMLLGAAAIALAVLWSQSLGVVVMANLLNLATLIGLQYCGRQGATSSASAGPSSTRNP